MGEPSASAQSAAAAAEEAHEAEASERAARRDRHMSPAVQSRGSSRAASASRHRSESPSGSRAWQDRGRAMRLPPSSSQEHLFSPPPFKVRCNRIFALFVLAVGLECDWRQVTDEKTAVDVNDGTIKKTEGKLAS